MARNSELNKYKDEIMIMRKEGKSYNQILDWLADDCGLCPDMSLLIRLVKKWSEED